MIPIYKPFLSEKSKDYAKDAITSGWISSIGEYVERATDELKRVTGSKYVTLVNNGTSATHLISKALHRRHPETKRVFVPSSCYVAAYNALLYDGNDWLLSPVDIDTDTWNMSVPNYEDGDAIMAVHNLGNIIDLSGVTCPIIEDSCEALFGEVKQPNSLCSSISFFGNKNITSGEGGAVLTDDEDIFNFVSKIKGQGQTKKRYIHDELGYNYRMTNIQAAILLGQLEDWYKIKEAKIKTFLKYDTLFNGESNIIPQRVDRGHSNWMYGVRLVGSKSYEENKKFFYDLGIDIRPMFYSFKKHSHLNISGDDKNINYLHKEIVIIPSYPEITDSEIQQVYDAIIKKVRLNENN